MILTVLALAQMPWTSHLPQHGLAFDFLRPSIADVETSLTSAAAYFSGRLPTGGGFAVRFEVPFAHVSVSGQGSTALGNPYLGLEKSSGPVTFEMGFRPALAPDDEVATQLGIYSDIMRFEAFFSHLATLSGRVIYRSQSASGATFEVGGGPSVWIPTEGDDTEVILHHYASAGYRGTKVWTAFGLGGLLVITEEGGFEERTIYQLGASVGLTQGGVRPALHLILPLDDAIDDEVDIVIGIGVAIPIK
jgi:hypothetical protein